MRYVWMLQIAVIVFGPPAVYAYRHRQDPPRATRGAGLIVAAMYTGFFGLFVAGEALTDPGGWAGAGLVAAWLIPVIALSWLARRRPDLARPILAGLVVAVGGLFVWSALDPEAWRTFEDDTGPLRGVLSLVLTAPLALLAVRYLRDAGVLLLILGAMPLVLLITGGGRVSWSIATLDLPVLVVGALFLIAARLGGATLTTRPEPPPPRSPTTTHQPHPST